MYIQSTREDFVTEDYCLLYDKRLTFITGSVNSALLLKQMMYWHKKSKGKFYKFINKCSHEKYQEGDSRCEEIGFSIDEFDTAIKNIGFKLGKNKNILTKEQAPIVYYTDSERVTWYSINTDVLNNLINTYLLVNRENPITKKIGIPELLLINTETTTETNTKTVLQNTEGYKDEILNDKKENTSSNEDNSNELENLEDENFDLPEQFFEPNKEQGEVLPKKEVGKKEKTSEQREKSAQVTAILLHIKAECKKNGVIFGSSSKERNAICWMMGKKFQEECLDEVNMDLLTFISTLIKTSVAINFRKTINSPESIYYNRSECVNKARQIRLAKETKDKPKEKLFDGDAYNESLRLQKEEVERIYQQSLLLKKQQC